MKHGVILICYGVIIIKKLKEKFEAQWKMSYFKLFIFSLLLTFVVGGVSFLVDYNSRLCSLLISVCAGGVTGTVFFLLSSIKTLNLSNLEHYVLHIEKTIISIYQFSARFNSYKKSEHEDEEDTLNDLHSRVIGIIADLDKLERNPYFRSDFKKHSSSAYESFYYKIKDESFVVNDFFLDPGAALSPEDISQICQYLDRADKLLEQLLEQFTKLRFVFANQIDTIKHSLI